MNHNNSRHSPNNKHKARLSQQAGQPPALPRRRFLQMLQGLGASAMVPWAMSQPGLPVAVRKLHHCVLRVSDVTRSLRFYQDLFAAPVQARQGDTVCLRIGDGPRFFALAPLRPGEIPGISTIGLSVEDFDAAAVQRQLRAFGVEPGQEPRLPQQRLDAAMTSWISLRRQDQGGDSAGTAELYFLDGEGLQYHLVDTDYCGGAGRRGAECRMPEPAPSAGIFQLVDYSHFTNFMANRVRANEFIINAFNKSIQAFQGPASPVIGVGDGLQFLMYVGGSTPEPAQNPGRIDHVCFSVTDFAVDPILERLTGYGLTARSEPANTGPLMHWISMRMPNRGGAERGTPELYFTDPDGIRIQLQAPAYCGGGGYLGDSCPAL